MIALVKANRTQTQRAPQNIATECNGMDPCAVALIAKSVRCVRSEEPLNADVGRNIDIQKSRLLKHPDTSTSFLPNHSRSAQWKPAKFAAILTIKLFTSLWAEPRTFSTASSVRSMRWLRPVIIAAAGSSDMGARTSMECCSAARSVPGKKAFLR